MPFPTKTWKDFPDESTPITAAELNRHEKGIKDAHAFIDSAPNKTYVDAAVKIVADEVDVMQTAIVNNSSAINVLTNAQTGQAAAITLLQKDKANKADLDKKADIVGLAKTLAEALPVPHVDGVVDFDTLDFGEHIVQTNNSVNGPPDTLVTLCHVLRTHSAGDHAFPFINIPDDQWEQGTTANGGQVGLTRDDLIRAANNLTDSRIRCKTLIPIEELGNIKITGTEFMFYVSYFGEDQKTLGRETFWTYGTIIAPPGARFYQVVVRKSDASNITPESVFGQFKVGTAKNDIIKGEGRLQIAWGATKGDLHIRIGTKQAGNMAFGMWNTIGSQLPAEAAEGSTIEFRSGKWVAVPPPQSS